MGSPRSRRQCGACRGRPLRRFTISVSCRVDGESAQVSFTTFRRTLIQQIMDSASAFFKLTPCQGQTAQLVLGGKQVISFTAQSTVEDLKLTTPDRQSLELVLLDEVRGGADQNAAAHGRSALQCLRSPLAPHPVAAGAGGHILCPRSIWE